MTCSGSVAADRTLRRVPTTTVLLQFAVASLLLAVTPGPSVVLVVASGADGGRRAGATTAIGLGLGTLVWGAVVAAGLGAVVAARPGVLQGVSAVGGAYLVGLGVRRWRSADEPPAPPELAAGRGPLLEGLVVNLLNPSIAVFLAAVLPPFVTADGAPAWQQVLALSGVLVLVSTLVNTSYGLAGDLVGRRVRRAAGSARARRAVAGVYAALGVLAIGSTVL
jgi:threonine/homoserine/homoserine lactone efflux protein